MLPAARMLDMHNCPMSDGPKPHVGGPISNGFPPVLIGYMPAARLGDPSICVGPPDCIAQGAATVLIGGKPAARQLDITFHGGVITSGFPTVLIGGPVASTWTMPQLLAILCPNDSNLVERIANGDITLEGYDRIYFDDPYYDGTQWTTKRFEAGGTSNGGITLLNNVTPEEAATTVYHEAIHHDQTSGTWSQREYDAYAETERWTIERGLPSQVDPSSGYNVRTTDAAGNSVVDESEIRRFVDDEYPIATAPPPGGGPPPDVPDTVVGRTPSGDTIVERADGSTYTRSPQAGDTYAGPQVTEGERVMDPALFQCSV